jgi:Domain of unknown function (DUF4340)
MRSWGLLALIVATAIAVVAAVMLSTGLVRPAPDRDAGGPVLPGFAESAAQADHVVLVHGDERITLVRQGDKWAVEEKGLYPVDSGKLRQLLLGLADLRYVEPKTRKPELYSRLQVENAGKPDSKSTLVTVSAEKPGVLAALILGQRRTDALGGGVDGIYLRKPEDPQSWLARGTLELPTEITAWLDRKLIDISLDKIKEVVLTDPGGAKLDIARDKPEDKFALKDAPADTKLKPETPIDGPARALADLELADVHAATDTPFPTEGVSHAVYTTFDGLTLSIDLYEKDGKHWAHFKADGTGDAEKTATELNDRLSPWVFGLLDYKAKLLTTKLADLTAAAKGS